MGGIRNDGVRTLEDIRLRCYVDPITDCWHWRMQMDGTCGRVNTVLDGKRRNTTARRAAVILSGRAVQAHQAVWRAVCCESEDCCNPEHASVGSRKQMVKHLAFRGTYRTPAHAAARLVGLQKIHAAVGGVMSESKACAILVSPLQDKEAAAEFGVSIRAVQDIRNRRKWKNVAPLPVASVFDLARAFALPKTGAQP